MCDHKIVENSLKSLQLLYILCLCLITCMKPRNPARLFWYISSHLLKTLSSFNVTRFLQSLVNLFVPQLIFFSL